MLDKELKKLFGIDVIDDGATSEDIDVLGTAVSSEDKETLYNDSLNFFDQLYVYFTYTQDGEDASEDVTFDDCAAYEVGEDSYDEAIAEEDYEE